jgi:hypothetical protein
VTGRRDGVERVAYVRDAGRAVEMAGEWSGLGWSGVMVATRDGARWSAQMSIGAA